MVGNLPIIITRPTKLCFIFYDYQVKNENKKHKGEP